MIKTLLNYLNHLKNRKEIIEWRKKGKPVPPPHIIKQQILVSFIKRFKLKIFVETGTYEGDMIEAMKKSVDQIYSIELSKKLYLKAKNRFRGEEKIELIYGDSGIELGNLMSRIDQPTLFWLDGHYSGGITARGNKDTPIYEELSHIFNAYDRRHVIIIDDAREFGTKPEYPTIKELVNFIKSKKLDTDIRVENDSIRIISNKVAN